MAYEFYVTIEAAKQGRMPAETDRKAHKGKLAGIGFSYEVTSPRDAAVTGIHQNVAAPEHDELDRPELEDIALTFQRIEIANLDAKTTASDSTVGKA